MTTAAKEAIAETRKQFLDRPSPTTMEKYIMITLGAWKDAAIDDADLINTLQDITNWLEH